MDLPNHATGNWAHQKTGSPVTLLFHSDDKLGFLLGCPSLFGGRRRGDMGVGGGGRGEHLTVWILLDLKQMLPIKNREFYFQYCIAKRELMCYTIITP